MRSTRTLVMLASTLMIGGTVAMASPASAAVSPSCVKVTKQGTRYTQPYVIVKNECSGTQRIKVVWAYGPDSSCNIVKPGKSFRDDGGSLARFDRLEKC